MYIVIFYENLENNRILFSCINLFCIQNKSKLNELVSFLSKSDSDGISSNIEHFSISFLLKLLVRQDISKTK
jgi:hypothetical protein